MSALGIALLSLALLAGGVAIGFYLARLGQSAEQAKLDEVKTEFDAYREQVTEHFAETATRFTVIGQQYRELYDHLATGSEALCLADKIEGKLPFPPAEAQQIAADELDGESVVEAAADLPPDVDTSEAESVASADDEAEVVAESAAVAEIDSGDEPTEAPTPEESAEEGEAEQLAHAETAAAEPLEGEIVDEDAAVTDNVVELVPRGEAREDETPGDSGDGDDKRTYH